MKFTCEKALLNQAVSLASHAVASKSPIEQLEGICVKAGGTVRMIGYNMDLGINVGLDADVQEQGECVMPTRLFCDIVRRLPDESVTVSVDETLKVKVRCGISEFTFMSMDASEYPTLPDVDADYAVRVEQREMKKMINGTVFCASTNMARPIHTGCLFEISGDQATVVAIDGYRLGMRRCATLDTNHPDCRFVVPASGLRELDKLLSDTEEPVSFSASSKYISFKSENAVLICRVLSGEFLDWRKVLPTANPINLIIDRDTLSRIMDRMSLMEDSKQQSPVRCVFEKDTARFRNFSVVGTAEDSCEITGDGKNLEIGFNCRYILEALRAIPTTEIRLEMNNSISPMVIRPCENNGETEEEFAYMVLPVRLKV